MKDKKKLTTIVSFIALIILIIGTSYAFLMAQLNGSASANLKLTAHSIDSLSFYYDGDFYFNLNQFNFNEGMSDLSDSISLYADLYANDETYQASYNYNVYLNIIENDFTYTTENREPEIILHVEGPEGEITTLNDLTYYEEYNGFDITEASGVIPIKENYQIAVNNEDENPARHDYVFTITFRNLPTDQYENSERFLIAKGVMQQEPLSEESNLFSDKIIADASADLIHHDGSFNDYEVYAPLGVGCDIFDSNELKVAKNHPEYNSAGDVITCECIENFYYGCNDNRFTGDAYYSLSYDTSGTLYTFDEAVEKALNDGYVEKYLDANDGSYRYAGNNPDNYVCLGDVTEDGQCEDISNLYRIIGIFPFNHRTNEQQTSYGRGMEYRVKLIKSEYITGEELYGYYDPSEGTTLSVDSSYTDIARIKNKENIPGFYWNTYEYSSWETEGENNKYNLWEYRYQSASLNEALNDYYLYNTLRNWQDKIADTTWRINGVFASDAYNTFKKEMINNTMWPMNVPQTTSTAKIGLIYVSDYGFAATNTNNLWLKYLGTYDGYQIADNINNNWLFNGINEWTITRYNDNNNTESAYNISYLGNVYYNSVFDNAYAVRPVFYLKADVQYASGNGSFNNPYTIK